MAKEDRYAIKKFSEKPLEGESMYSDVKVQPSYDQLSKREQILYEKYKDEIKDMAMKPSKDQTKDTGAKSGDASKKSGAATKPQKNQALSTSAKEFRPKA